MSGAWRKIKEKNIHLFAVFSLVAFGALFTYLYFDGFFRK
jgi:hypothetical protein